MAAILKRFVVLGVVFATASGSTVRRSNDELVLRYLPHLSTPKLTGETGTMHQLAFELMNNGNNAQFQLRQEGSDGFEGHIIPGPVVSLPSKTVKTITIINLMVPTAAIGSFLTYTLSAEKQGGVVGQMSEVSSTLKFLVGDPMDLVDDEKPTITKEFGGSCKVSRNDSTCGNYQWHMEYHVKDDVAGLLEMSVQAAGKDSYLSPVMYSMPNYPIGTRDVVDVVVDISCCVEGVLIRAVDLTGNEAIVESYQGENLAVTLSKSIQVIISCIFILKLIM